MIFRNSKEVLLPGVYVRAVVEEGVREQAILVPQQGVVRDVKGNPMAWVVNKDNIVDRRALELDRTIGDKWLVTKGLAAGDRMIIEGFTKVRVGMPVKAVPFIGKPASTEGQQPAERKAKGEGNHV